MLYLCTRITKEKIVLLLIITFFNFTCHHLPEKVDDDFGLHLPTAYLFLSRLFALRQKR